MYFLTLMYLIIPIIGISKGTLAAAINPNVPESARMFFSGPVEWLQNLTLDFIQQKQRNECTHEVQSNLMDRPLLEIHMQL